MRGNIGDQYKNISLFCSFGEERVAEDSEQKIPPICKVSDVGENFWIDPSSLIGAVTSYMLEVLFF